MHSVAVVLRVFWVCFCFFLINNACWPLFSSVVWKVLNVAKFKELGKGVVDVRQRQKMPFFSPALLAL